QTLKIVDFGIAKALSETTMTQTNHVVGTVQYLSPEQAKGEKTGERSDIYSIGIVLYEMLTGHPPFSGETAVSIAIKQIQEAVPNVTDTRRDVPQALSNVILKATEKDQSHRYRSVSEMAHDVMSTLDPTRQNEAIYEVDGTATKTVPINKNALKAEQAKQGQAFDETAQIPIVTPEKQPQGQPKPKPQPAYYSPPPKRSGRKKWIFGVILLLLLGSLFIFMGAAMTGDKYSQVPEVLGKSRAQAEKLLKDNKLTVGDVTYDYSDRYSKDQVMTVDPEEGSKVEQESSVDLVISKGQRVEAMPNLVGMTKQDAERRLKELGFTHVTFTTAYTKNNIEKGHIESQSIQPGQNVAVTQDKVEVTESLGKRQVYVGDYTNKDIDDVKAELEEKGLVVKIEKERSDRRVKKHHIINHSPKKTNVEEGDTVSFIVSTGEKEDDEDSDSAVKAYSETVNIPYTGENDKPQKVEVFITDKNDNGQSPAETFNITRDTPQTMQFVIEKNKSAKYVIKVDGKTVARKTIDFDDF
ncbi:PASTA domain-containing protein, partial [Staphylococcus pseudintermedius]|nr:PASTA domain-containing protein [Staphylococcus pseudintermedius]